MPSKHATLLAAATLVFCCSVPLSAQRPPLYPSSTERMSRIQADYSASISRLNRVCDWQFCRDPELRRTWTLLGEWLSSYLDDHPAASAVEVVASAKELYVQATERPRDGEATIELQADVMELGWGEFLVAANYFETGTFFVVGRGKEGPSRVIWSIDRDAAA